MVGGKTSRTAKIKSILLILLVIIAHLLSGCSEDTDGGGSGGNNQNGNLQLAQEKLTSDEIKAMNILIEFAVVCDDTTLELIGIMSDDFTKPFLALDLEITDEEYDKIYELEERILSYEDDVMWALHVLESKSSSGSLIGASSTSATLSLIMPKASASPSPGIISKLVDLYYTLKRLSDNSPVLKILSQSIIFN